MFYHGHFTHPELWQMWFAFIGTTLNTAAVIYLIYKENKK